MVIGFFLNTCLKVCSMPFHNPEHKTARARPLYLNKRQLEELGKAVACGDPEILDWIRAFFKGCFGKTP
jgi:hypothetical protein